jgi:hypothetical protein
MTKCHKILDDLTPLFDEINLKIRNTGWKNTKYQT